MKQISGMKMIKNMKLFFYKIEAVALGIMLCGTPIVANAAPSASENATVTALFQNLLNTVTSFVSMMGAIYTLWGIFEFSTAMSSGEGTMSSQAFKRMGGGIVAVFAPQILTAIIG